MDDKLFEIITDIECVCGQLDELDMVLSLLDEEMGRGRQSNEDFVDWKAANFVLRLPYCLALLHTIRLGIKASTKELEIATNTLLELKKEATENTNR